MKLDNWTTEELDKFHILLKTIGRSTLNDIVYRGYQYLEEDIWGRCSFCSNLLSEKDYKPHLSPLKKELYGDDSLYKICSDCLATQRDTYWT